jgi:UDP-2,3-diacylglucosamine hydrolase
LKETTIFIQLDIPVYENEGFFQINNLKVRCEHGDYINPDDQVYLAYRENVRRPWMEWLAHNLPSHFWKAIGELYSRKNRSKTSRYAIDNSERVRAMIQAYAMKVYNAEPFDLIITGHMHVFDDYTFSVNTRKVRSINLGTWLSEPIVLLIDNDGVRTVNVFSLVNSG